MTVIPLMKSKMTAILPMMMKIYLMTATLKMMTMMISSEKPAKS